MMERRDPKEILGRINNGNNLDLNKIREADFEQALLDRITSRGKPTIMDLMMFDMWRGMHGNGNSNVQEIVQKAIEQATYSYKNEIEELKRRLEKQEEERRQEAIQRQIDEIKSMILNKPKDDGENPILKKLETLEQQLRDEKEKAEKREREQFEERIENMIEDINERIANLKTAPETKDKIQQIIELEKEKQELLKALGVKPSEKEEASISDIVNGVVDNLPKAAKTVSTIKDIFSKEDQIPDDVPDDVPTQIPQRNVERKNEIDIPADIKEFLDKGREEGGQYIDYTGVGWTDLQGNPLSRKDIETLALTDPTTVRRFIKEAEEDAKKLAEKAKETKKEKENEEKKENEENDRRSEEEHNEEKEEKSVANEDDLKEAMDYINSGEDKKDDAGNTVWVGTKNEIYTKEDGSPATKEDLIEEAKKDPKEFMKTVREHLKSLGE